MDLTSSSSSSSSPPMSSPSSPINPSQPSSSSSSSASLSSTTTITITKKKKNEYTNKWQSPTQHRLYRHRLLHALSSPKQTPHNPHTIKAAADSALALSALGRTRWSRAILNRRRCTLRRVKLRRGNPPKRNHNYTTTITNKTTDRSPDNRVGDRLRRLSHLVPGCRGAPTGSLLEEAADYVAALEVQVRAMRELADALSATTITRRAEAENVG